MTKRIDTVLMAAGVMVVSGIRVRPGDFKTVGMETLLGHMSGDAGDEGVVRVVLNGRVEVLAMRVGDMPAFVPTPFHTELILREGDLVKVEVPEGWIWRFVENEQKMDIVDRVYAGKIWSDVRAIIDEKEAP